MYDEIIVGAGSAGAVVAARLSENSSRRVLLIEAGADYAGTDDTPASLLNGLRPATDHDWGFEAEMVPGRSVAYARGMVTGGSSAVNACLALRGHPADYDEWANRGNTDWGWSDVQPVFRALEHDVDIVDEHHGQDGPMLVRRVPVSDLTPSQHVFYNVCRALGFPETADHNNPKSTGVSTGPWNRDKDNVRISTAIGYLHPARSRSNLTIRSGCLVDRVLFDDKKAIGVEIFSGEGREQVFAKRVTLSAGAIGTRTILMRSGIGPAEDLRSVGIEPLIDRPGVGRNLIDHARVTVNWTAPPGIVEESSPYLETVLRYTAPGSNHFNDMQVMLFQTLPQPDLQLKALLVKPESSGYLKLKSADPTEAPDIRLNLLSTPEDMRRMCDGMRMLGRMIERPEMVQLGAGTLTLADDQVMSAQDFRRKLQDDAWLSDYVHRTVLHYVHPVGTARMGPSSDTDAVTDQRGRVHGIMGLRVADASIIPTVPSANTNLPCIMIGERIATWMRTESD